MASRNAPASGPVQYPAPGPTHGLQSDQPGRVEVQQPLPDRVRVSPVWLEESVDQGEASLDAVQLVAHRGGELIGGADGDVAQAVLHHRPDPFDRLRSGA